MIKETKMCSKCKKTKSVDEFSKGQSQCKECHYKQNAEILENQMLEFLSYCIENGEVKSEELGAARLLLKSARSRWRACKYRFKGYENVTCDYDSYESFFLQLIKLEKFWNDWKKQSLIYKRTKQYIDRPSIDRIDSDCNYTLDNVQVLSIGDNVMKATCKPCEAVIIKNERIIGKFHFDSKKQFYDELGKYYDKNILKAIPFDTASFQELDADTTILLQTDSIDKETAGDDELKYRLEYKPRREYYDLDTMKIVKVEHFEPFYLDVARVFIN